MWKKTWVLGILLAATMLSGCSSCGTPPDPGGEPTTDGGSGPTTDGGDGSTTDGGDGSNPDGGDPGKSLTSLTLSPTSKILVVKGTTVATQQFTVTGSFADGHSEDVTAQASFSIDDTRLGGFQGSTFTSNTTVGGTSTVRARVGAMSSATSLTVKLEQKVSDSTSGAPTVPAEPETKFGGTVDASRKPELVYPNNNVLVPPNLGQLEIHFTPGPTQNTLFELAFTNAVTDVRVYLRCYVPSGFTLPSGVSRGCIYTPSEEVWKFPSAFSSPARRSRARSTTGRPRVTPA
jgi:hypothetical protein